MKPETEALLDLMINRALHGLDDEDRDRLDLLLLNTDPEQVSELEQQLEAALAVAGNASALEHAARDPGESNHPPAMDFDVPAALVRTLEADADRFFGSASGGTDDARATGVTQLQRPSPGPARAGDERDSAPPARGRWTSSPGVFGWGGWAVAALLLVTIWVGRPGSTPEPGTPPTAAEARVALLGLSETMQTPWGDSAWEEFDDVQGDVVWNDELQEGYLRLANMPANDPSRTQYQLWIVDPARDEEPVDGGVFDIPPGAREVVVPIRAKLAVRSPSAFAITREQPGGVVVSEGPLLVVASRG
jgi:hypothetical protein